MDNQLSFEDFEKDWRRKHKSSLPRKAKVSSAQEYFWILFWLMVATGAAIFSAAHTIPAAEMTLFVTLQSRAQLAVTAFIIVELVIFGAAAKRREIPWLMWLLIGSLIVALLGNTSSSVRAVAENGGDILNQIGGVVLSIIAPFTALAAGEVLHIQLDKLAAKRNEAQTVFEALCREAESKILQAFTKYEKAFIEYSVNSVNALQSIPVHSVNSVNSTNGYTKQMNSRQIISEYFEQHPEFKNMTLDQLNQAIEQESGVRVGRTSIHNVRKTWALPPIQNENPTLQ